MRRAISSFLASTHLPAAVGVQAGRLCDFGFVMLQKYQFSQALERFQTVLGDEPSCVAALFGMALALEGLGKTALALRTVQRAEALLPSPNARLLLLRAELLLGLRRYVWAGEACEAALALNPALLRAQWLRLKLLFVSGLGNQTSVAQRSGPDTETEASGGVVAPFDAASEFVRAAIPVEVR